MCSAQGLCFENMRAMHVEMSFFNVHRPPLASLIFLSAQLSSAKFSL